MFSYTLHQRSLSKGVSPDAIPPSAKNQFDSLSNGHSSLNGRLQVRLNDKVIRFFYYLGKDLQEPRIERMYKEVASISLTDSKETDNDILYLAEHCKEKFGNIRTEEFEELAKDFEELAKDLREWELGDKSYRRLFGFPFLENELTKGTFAYLIQECFLYFILDFENRSSDFSLSPFYDKVRDKLRKSFVYRLLCAKIHYTIYLFEQGEPGSQDEYTYKTEAFARLLMDGEINKFIPPSYYSGSKGIAWFFNPEEELEHIVARNSENKNTKLKEAFLLDIRDFFYRKHAVISAVTIQCACWSKPLYFVYRVFVLLFSVYATFCYLFYDTEKPVVDFFFKNYSIWACLSLGLIAIQWILLLMNNKSLNVFMPRVLVALSIGWLTAFISEDLIKSQLEIPLSLTSVALLVVLFIIGVLLYGEAKQHSPYYKLLQRHSSPSSKKLFPVILHSYFWALVMGTAMQLYIYPGLLENSKALPEIVYEDTFDDAENYVIRLDNFKDALSSYRQDLDEMYVKTTISGVESSASALTFLKADMRYSNRELEKIRLRRLSKFQHIKQIYDDIYSINSTKQVRLDSVVSIKVKDNRDLYLIGSIDSIRYGRVNYYEITDGLNQLSESASSFDKNLSPLQVDRSVNSQLACLDEIIDATEEEIQRIKLFVSDNNKYEQLIQWSSNEMHPYGDGITVDEILKNEAIQKHYFVRNVSFGWSDRHPIFPRMLILHALMVLIIAFVGQLIISDKSVTEPL